MITVTLFIVALVTASIGVSDDWGGVMMGLIFTLNFTFGTILVCIFSCLRRKKNFRKRKQGYVLREIFLKPTLYAYKPAKTEVSDNVEDA
jgi:hypothetical protein